MPIPPSNNGGFTLLEIVISMLIILTGILALTGVLSASLYSAKRSQDDLLTTQFASMIFGYYSSAQQGESIPPGTAESFIIPGNNAQRIKLNNNDISTIAIEFSPNAPPVIFTYRFIPRKIGALKTLHLDLWVGQTTNNTPSTFFTEIYPEKTDE